MSNVPEFLLFFDVKVPSKKLILNPQQKLLRPKHEQICAESGTTCLIHSHCQEKPLYADDSEMIVLWRHLWGWFHIQKKRQDCSEDLIEAFDVQAFRVDSTIFNPSYTYLQFYSIGNVSFTQRGPTVGASPIRILQFWNLRDGQLDLWGFLRITYIGFLQKGIPQ